ncbi:MAG: hypothetical protein ACRCSF_10620 [Mycobacteriaceae bacterium]
MVKGIATIFTGEAFSGNRSTLLLLLGVGVCTAIAIMVARRTKLLTMALVSMFIAIFPVLIPTAVLPNVSSQAITMLSPVLCNHPYTYGDMATNVSKSDMSTSRYNRDAHWVTNHELICHRPDGSTQLVSTNKVQIWWYTISWAFFAIIMFIIISPLGTKKPSDITDDVADAAPAQG